MNSLGKEPVAGLLERLHRAATLADRPLVDAFIARAKGSGKTLEQLAADVVEQEKTAPRGAPPANAEYFMAVSPAFGLFLYLCARAAKAIRIVEFGTSMGISTIYLAAALRDNGGGRLIGSEMVPDKVRQARAHVDGAGLADLVEIRAGDALDTLADVGGDIDLVLLDGAFSLYLPVLKLLEARLRPGAVILAENAFDKDYLAYVRNPANGYLSQPAPVDEGRGNEFSVRTA